MKIPKEVQIVKEITTHAGEKFTNGGEYGFTTYFFRQDNDEWIVNFSTTAGFDYCHLCGSFHAEKDCWLDRPGIITTQQLQEELQESKVVNRYGTILTVDSTGHDEMKGRNGGCKICYPSCA